MKTRFLWGVMETSSNQKTVIVAQPCDNTKNHWIVYFERVSFIACELSQLKKKKGRGKRLVEFLVN